MKHKRHRTKRHKRHNKSSKKGYKLIKGLKNTTQKIIPKFRYGLESVGEKVRTTTTTSVPLLQKSFKNFLGNNFSTKHKKSYKK